MPQVTFLELNHHPKCAPIIIVLVLCVFTATADYFPGLKTRIAGARRAPLWFRMAAQSPPDYPCRAPRAPDNVFFSRTAARRRPGSMRAQTTGAHHSAGAKMAAVPDTPRCLGAGVSLSKHTRLHSVYLDVGGGFVCT